MKWRVWRQDDHGNNYLISSFDTEAAARKRVEELEARQHKQHYWIDKELDPTFADHFSGHARDYAAARPTYPTDLFTYLANLSSNRNCAWDCATGSGQAARELSHHFNQVIATDASARQIDAAKEDLSGAKSIDYRVAKAEQSGLENGSVDLITVAQALHWFDFEKFYTEVKRVAKPKAHLAAWCYELAEISDRIDAIVYEFYTGPIEEFWPRERKYIESAYRDIPFPFETVDSPIFNMTLDWSAQDLIAYLRTWSSVKRFQEANGTDPVDAIEKEITEAWGDSTRRVNWPLTLKVGKILPDREV